MVDNIQLQQIMPPSSPATRIKPVKQKQSNMRNRGFKKSLKDEEEEHNKRNKNGRKSSENSKAHIDGEKLSISGANNDNDVEPDLTKSYNDHRKSKLIDIVV